MTEQVMKRCFIITPIGGERSEIRDALDGLLNNVLKPLLLELGFIDEDITVAHQMTDSGSINTQLITRIIEDELCIVNLTGLNPNVMYELAVRHAVGKPVVIIAENGTKLPFDIVDQRTIFYKDTMLGAVELKESLRDMVSAILSKSEQTPDNPIIKIIKDNAILNDIKSDGRDHGELSLILNKISNLEERIVNTEKRKYSTEGTTEIGYQRCIIEYEGSLDIVDLNGLPASYQIDSIVDNSKSTNRVVIRFPVNTPNKELDELKLYFESRGVTVIRIKRFYS